ncbi:hypothetical protein IIU_06079 [Bacillus cereus VD133]|uniref:Uncharacterized protein n=1 Tax=Bacillus cereus VD133 TaxID=1053233 RepID=A0A9W5PL16_BACCE|nr:hypothetical protein IIU_06079 [Bacillus cereus VD133]
MLTHPKTKKPAPVKEKEVETNAPTYNHKLTVEATAYTVDPSENGDEYGEHALTAIGHDLTANPNMKMVAVDPKVISLGSTVWVEGIWGSNRRWHWWCN